MTDYLPPPEQLAGAAQGGLLRRLSYLERTLAGLVIGAVPSYSYSHPANPSVGMTIYEQDTGLTAMWTGSAWNYPGVQLLAKTVLSASTTSVRIPAVGSLPQVFTNARLVISAQSSGSGAGGFDAATLQINGVTASNYDWNSFYAGQGSGVMNVAGANAVASAQIAEIWNSHFGSAGRGLSTVEFPDYANTVSLKSWTALSTAVDGGTVGILQTYGGSLGASNVAAITSLTVAMSTGSFLAGSTFCVYGFD